MKIHTGILLISFLGLLACKKDLFGTMEQPVYWGTAEVDKNGTPWKPSPYASISNRVAGTFNLSLSAPEPVNYLTEQFAIYKIPLLPGTYPLRNTTIQTIDTLVGAAFFFTNSDVLAGDYYILESDTSSFVTLNSFDERSQEVKGTFEVTLKSNRRPYGAPDTIRLRNGVFHTKLLQ